MMEIPRGEKEGIECSSFYKMFRVHIHYSLTTSSIEKIPVCVCVCEREREREREREIERERDGGMERERER